MGKLRKKKITKSAKYFFAVPPTITEAYPPLPLDELTAALAKFSSSSLPEKQTLIKRLVDRHVILNLRWGGKWRYRRARKLSPGQIPQTVDELIWRKGVPAALGRANPAGFQVLYLADRRDTAFREARVEDHPIMLAEFEILPGRSIHVAPIGEMAMIQRTGRGFLGGEDVSSLNAFINACDRDEATSLLILDAFLHECLTNRDDDYEISSCVARSVFEKLPAVSAVAYQSRRQLGAICFAVRVVGFWSNWGVSSVRRGQATHLAQGYYQFTDVKNVTGIYTKGGLEWDEQVAHEDTSVLLRPLWTPSSVS